VHLLKRVALKLLWRAFERYRSLSASVKVSGTEATECGKFFLLFGIYIYIYIFFFPFVVFHFFFLTFP
jgi:hypothetical protein